MALIHNGKYVDWFKCDIKYNQVYEPQHYCLVQQ